MRLYLTVRPEDVREAAPYRRELAHAAYHIGEESALLRRNLLVQTSGGLLVLSDRGAPPVEDPEGLAGALLRECGRRSYSGIVLDFEMPPRRDLSDLAAALGRSCAAGHRPLYLPEAYAKLTAHRIVIINTAVSGGSFEEHLREVISLYGGSQHIALDVQLLRMCFSLPAHTGLHDIYSTSVDAALQIVDTLEEQGYWLVTVEELLTLGGIQPQEGVLYRSARK